MNTNRQNCVNVVTAPTQRGFEPLPARNKVYLPPSPPPPPSPLHPPYPAPPLGCPYRKNPLPPPTYPLPAASPTPPHAFSPVELLARLAERHEWTPGRRAGRERLERA